MQPFCFEPPLSVSAELPLQGAGLRIERVKLSVVTTDVNRAVSDGRCSGHRPACRPLPNLMTGRSVDRVYVSVVSAKVDHVIFEHGRRNHAIASWKFPFHTMELSRRRSGISAGMHRIAAKH